jgi:hypothetical protein
MSSLTPQNGLSAGLRSVAPTFYISKLGINLEPEIFLYASDLAIPLSSISKKNLNYLVRGFKSGICIDKLSDFFDVVYMLGAETSESSLKNIVKNAYHCTAINSPIFKQYEGWIGGVGKYLNTHFNPSVNGIKFVKDNSSLGVYSRTNSDGQYVDIGCRDVGAGESILLLKYSNHLIGRLNNISTVQITDSATSSLGLGIITRNGATKNDLTGYSNKNTLTNRAGTANTNNVPNQYLYILATNDSGSDLYHSNRQISFAFASKYITPAIRDVIWDNVTAYLTYYGKAVA